MKCECEECNGSGEIECPECEGQGTFEGGIESLHLEKSIHNYEELVELQEDAKRVMRQATQLKQLNPQRSESYDAQLKATLAVINKEADRKAKK